jgi:hypothetical protein
MVTCPKRAATYLVYREYEGLLFQCEHCQTEMVCPIHAPDRLLQWVEQSPLQDVMKFIRMRGAAGHTETTIDNLVAMVEKRR